MVVVERAETPEQFDTVASLMRDFSNWALATVHTDDALPPDVFTNLESELAKLPGRFASPKGTLLIAKLDGQTVGCLGGAPLDDVRIEAARLWVDPTGRGHNIGALLIKRLIEHAKAAGFRSVVLRSHKDMASAHALYRAAGFALDPSGRDFDTLQSIELAMALPIT